MHSHQELLVIVSCGAVGQTAVSACVLQLSTKNSVTKHENNGNRSQIYSNQNMLLTIL